MAEPVSYATHLPLRTLTTEHRQDYESPAATQERETHYMRQKKGNPFKRGNTWTYIVYVDDPNTGKRKQVWKGGFKTKREAQAALTIAKAKAKTGELIQPSKMTFSEYYEHFMECKDVAFRPTTMQSYKTAFKMAKSIHDKRIDKITVNDLKRLDSEMDAAGYKPSTKATYHRRYRSIFNFAVKHDDIVKSPYLKFTSERLPKRDATMPETETLKEMIDKARETALLIYGAVLFGLTMGLRRGEILGLKFGDFDMDKNTVHIQRQKSSVTRADIPLKTETSDRVLALPTIVRTYVESQRELLSATNDDYVVTDEKGKIHRPNGVSRLFKRFVDSIDMSGFRLHDLRHGYVSMCMEQNVPLKIISDTLGHAKIETTANIYCDTMHLRSETAKAIDRILTLAKH